RRAARAFERYLGRGGPLAEEAHWGRIQALDKLGDVDGRARALAAFTAAYPSSVYLARARALEDGE
ncbi:MAG: hypothetical protein KC636_38035, partial [Myxococcales bacterium]|nr:hypothetical protein [Myxococcales bacterium]